MTGKEMFQFVIEFLALCDQTVEENEAEVLAKGILPPEQIDSFRRGAAALRQRFQDAAEAVALPGVALPVLRKLKELAEYKHQARALAPTAPKPTASN